jgi:NADPH:quinone reductase-like Zn-dependent oxidoreductase
MRAYVLDAYGKNAPLRLAEVSAPTAGDDDVLIEVHAAGLNPLDSKIRDGEFKLILPYTMPLIPGHDVAGRVVAVGRSVRQFAVGDEVYARPRDGRIGGFAELIAVNADDVAHKPAALTMAEAASLPLTALTAWQALVEIARVRAGQSVLIHAGSGGVGTLAIQLAKSLGATVATTAGSASAELVRSLGADVVIDYRREDFRELLSNYDVVLASQDTETLYRSLEVLKPGGVLISISGPPDAAFARARGMNWFMQQVIGLMSSRVRRRARARGVDYRFLFMRANGAQLTEITSLVDRGALRPVIDRTLPFESLPEAFAYLDQGRAKGKVVVTVR